MNRQMVTLYLIIVITLFTSAGLSAEPVTFEVSATVYNVSDPGNTLQNSINSGDKITGTYTIDMAAPDDDPNPEYGHYIFYSTTNSALGIDLTVNSHTFKSDPSISGHMYQAYIMNSYSDHFGISSWGNQPLPVGANVDDIFIDLYDPSGQALASDALPQQAPNVSNFDIHEIHISGSTYTGDYFYMDATIDNIQLPGGECVPSSSNMVAFSVAATVREIYDYSNELGGAINIGDSITGTYTFNTATPDSDPYPEYGRYEHTPGSGDYGFNINIANFNLKTDTSTDMFTIMIGNAADSTGWDSYSADQYGSQLPFINGTTVDGIGMYIDDPTGTSVTTTALTDQPPSLSGTGYRDFYFTGMRDPNLSASRFSVVADLNSITLVGGGCEEKVDPVVVSPGSGVYDAMQRFDMAIVAETDLPPVTGMQATLNGFDISPELSRCFPGSPNSQNRQTFVCPDFSNLLMPGKNRFRFTFKLDNGQSVHHNTDLLLLGY